MRYGVFSDVHSNLEAFEAVLSFFNNSNIDKYIFLGDIVGYGADPVVCIDRLKRLNVACIAGNHDWAAVELTDIDYFNRTAKSAVLWTRENIGQEERLFLSGLELVKKMDGYCIVHGTLNQPQEFDYMTDGVRAAKTFTLLEQKICFVGHSHCPGVFIESEDNIQYKELQVLKVEDGRRYIVNDGSVGQPRDGDPRACCCIYDDEAGVIEFKRVGYDVALAQKKIIGAGLPETLALRLAVGR